MGGHFSKNASAGGWLASYVPACLLPIGATGGAKPEPEANNMATGTAPDTAGTAAVDAPPAPPVAAAATTTSLFSSLLLRALWHKQQDQQQSPPGGVASTTGLNAKPQPKPAVNPADLLLRGLQRQTVVKAPGALGGAPQPFAIEGCKGCDVYVLEATAQVTVDDCVDCRLVLGPCAGSVFLRDCTRCAVVAACQQFRTRGCTELDLWLYAATALSIESSHSLRLGCYGYAYDALAAQFATAGLDPKGANRWWDVYDFTPEEHKDTPHFTLVPDGPAAVIKPLPAEVATQVGYSEDPERRVVPFTKAPSP